MPSQSIRSSSKVTFPGSYPLLYFFSHIYLIYHLQLFIAISLFTYCFPQILSFSTAGNYLMFHLIHIVLGILLTLSVCEWIDMQTGKQGFPNILHRKK